MEPLKKFNENLSLNTKIIVPLTFFLLLFSYWLKDLKEGFVLASILSLIFVLLIDYYIIAPKYFPNVWQIIKWVTILGIILLTLIA